MTEQQMQRFWSKVDRGPSDGCWPWLASKRDGYGCFHLEGTTKPAHRLSYELSCGPIPEGLVIDHICRNRACVNPTHLRAVTRHENVHENSDAPAYHNAIKTECYRGHPLSGDNLVIDKRGRRTCRSCHSRKLKEYFARHPRTKPPEQHVKPGSFNRNKTHCKRGHPFEGSNLIITKKGERRCRACESARRNAAAASPQDDSAVGESRGAHE